jgi:hypothetical protein
MSTNPETTYISLDPETTENKPLGSFFPGYSAIAYNRNVNFVYEPGETPRLIVPTRCELPIRNYVTSNSA